MLDIYQSKKIKSEVTPIQFFLNIANSNDSSISSSKPKSNSSSQNYLVNKKVIPQKPPSSSKPIKNRPTPKNKAIKKNPAKNSEKEDINSPNLSRHPDIQKMYYNLAQSSLTEHISVLQASCTPQEFSTITSLWAGSLINKSIEQQTKGIKLKGSDFLDSIYLPSTHLFLKDDPSSSDDIGYGELFFDNHTVKCTFKQILGICLNIELMVLSTQQKWTLFVPSNELLNQLGRISKGKTEKAKNVLKTFCQNILHSLVVVVDLIEENSNQESLMFIPPDSTSNTLDSTGVPFDFSNVISIKSATVNQNQLNMLCTAHLREVFLSSLVRLQSWFRMIIYKKIKYLSIKQVYEAYKEQRKKIAERAKESLKKLKKEKENQLNSRPPHVILKEKLAYYTNKKIKDPNRPTLERSGNNDLKTQNLNSSTSINSPVLSVDTNLAKTPPSSNSSPRKMSISPAKSINSNSNENSNTNNTITFSDIISPIHSLPMESTGYFSNRNETSFQIKHLKKELSNTFYQFEEELNDLKSELEQQRLELFYRRRGDFGLDDQNISSISKFSKAQDETIQKMEKEANALKEEILFLKNKVSSLEGDVSLQVQVTREIEEHANTKIAETLQSAEKILTQTAQQARINAFEEATAKLNAKEKELLILEERFKAFEISKDSEMKAEIQRSYRHIEAKILAEKRESSQRESAMRASVAADLRNELAELFKVHQLQIEDSNSQNKKEFERKLDLEKLKWKQLATQLIEYENERNQPKRGFFSRPRPPQNSNGSGFTRRNHQGGFFSWFGSKQPVKTIDLSILDDTSEKNSESENSDDESDENSSENNNENNNENEEIEKVETIQKSPSKIKKSKKVKNEEDGNENGDEDDDEDDDGDTFPSYPTFPIISRTRGESIGSDSTSILGIPTLSSFKDKLKAPSSTGFMNNIVSGITTINNTLNSAVSTTLNAITENININEIKNLDTKFSNLITDIKNSNPIKDLNNIATNIGSNLGLVNSTSSSELGSQQSSFRSDLNSEKGYSGNVKRQGSSRQFKTDREKDILARNSRKIQRNFRQFCKRMKIHKADKLLLVGTNNKLTEKQQIRLKALLPLAKITDYSGPLVRSFYCAIDTENLALANVALTRAVELLVLSEKYSNNFSLPLGLCINVTKAFNYDEVALSRGLSVIYLLLKRFTNESLKNDGSDSYLSSSSGKNFLPPSLAKVPSSMGMSSSKLIQSITPSKPSPLSITIQHVRNFSSLIVDGYTNYSSNKGIVMKLIKCFCSFRELTGYALQLIIPFLNDNTTNGSKSKRTKARNEIRPLVSFYSKQDLASYLANNDICKFLVSSLNNNSGDVDLCKTILKSIYYTIQLNRSSYNDMVQHNVCDCLLVSLMNSCTSMNKELVELHTTVISAIIFSSDMLPSLQDKFTKGIYSNIFIRIFLQCKGNIELIDKILELIYWIIYNNNEVKIRLVNAGLIQLLIEYGFYLFSTYPNNNIINVTSSTSFIFTPSSSINMTKPTPTFLTYSQNDLFSSFFDVISNFVFFPSSLNSPFNGHSLNIVHFLSGTCKDLRTLRTNVFDFNFSNCQYKNKFLDLKIHNDVIEKAFRSLLWILSKYDDDNFNILLSKSSNSSTLQPSNLSILHNATLGNSFSLPPGPNILTTTNTGQNKEYRRGKIDVDQVDYLFKD